MSWSAEWAGDFIKYSNSNTLLHINLIQYTLEITFLVSTDFTNMDSLFERK